MKKAIPILIAAVFLASTFFFLLSFRNENPNDVNIENRYKIPSSLGTFDIFDNVYVKKYVIIRYPELEGTEFDEKVNKAIAAHAKSWIEETNLAYASKVEAMDEWAKGLLLLADVRYDVEVVFENILKVTYTYFCGGGMWNQTEKRHVHIDLTSGELVHLSDVVAVDERLVSFKAATYLPPNETSVVKEAALSFQDAFPNYDGWDLLRDIEAGTIGWSLEKDRLCIYEPDQKNGSFIFIPYSDIPELVSPLIKGHLSI